MHWGGSIRLSAICLERTVKAKEIAPIGSRLTLTASMRKCAENLVTQPGHGLHFGHVLRGSIDVQAISIGEGWAMRQIIPGLSHYINDVWSGQNQRNIDDAR